MIVSTYVMYVTSCTLWKFIYVWEEYDPSIIRVIVIVVVVEDDDDDDDEPCVIIYGLQLKNCYTYLKRLRNCKMHLMSNTCQPLMKVKFWRYWEQHPKYYDSDFHAFSVLDCKNPEVRILNLLFQKRHISQMT